MEHLGSGEEASVFKAQNKETKVLVVILALKNAKDASNRIKIHEILNGIPYVV